MKLLVENQDYYFEALKISVELGINIVHERADVFSDGLTIGMTYDSKGLGLIYKDAIQPIYVDFNKPVKLERCRMFNQENLFKAIKIKNIPHPSVIDATAGLGEDSLILAAAGCNVLMLERSPFIGALLKDGLRRARGIAAIIKIIDNLDLKFGNSIDLLPELTADVVYLDPMFPTIRKTALAKKEMMAFKFLIGADLDSDELLKISLERAKHKVVVKRPIYAPYINNRQSTYSLKGKVCRFDVYQIF